MTKQMERPRYSNQRYIQDRVPFYWKRSGALQAILASWTQGLSHIPTIVLFCVGIALAMTNSIFFAIMCIPFLVWSIPMGLFISYLVSTHRSISPFDWDYMGLDCWYALSKEKKKELKPLAKAVRSSGQIKHLQEFHSIVKGSSEMEASHSSSGVDALIKTARDKLEAEKEAARITRQIMQEQGWE